MRKPKVVDGVNHWYCRPCNRWLPPESFRPDDKLSSGLASNCKECVSLKAKKYYDINNAMIKAKRDSSETRSIALRAAKDKRKRAANRQAIDYAEVLRWNAYGAWLALMSRTVAVKVCRKCGRAKYRDDFEKRPTISGCSSWCKDCSNKIRSAPSTPKRSPRSIMGAKTMAAGKCEVCAWGVLGSIVGLNGHHCLPVADGGDSSPENMVCLCACCHALAHWWLRESPWERVTRETTIAAVRHIIDTGVIPPGVDQATGAS